MVMAKRASLLKKTPKNHQAWWFLVTNKIKELDEISVTNSA